MGHESHQRGTNAHLTAQEVTASTSAISFFFWEGGRGVILNTFSRQPNLNVNIFGFVSYYFNVSCGL